MRRTMRLCDLLPDVAGIPSGLRVSGLAEDSRRVRPGDAFLAVAADADGSTGAHGLGFVAQARAAGAEAVLFEPPAPPGLPPPADAIAVPGLRGRMGAIAARFHGQPSRAMTMVGVTGTSGKTSVVQLLAQALTLAGRRTGTIGTLGAGLYGQLRATGFTTPLVLQTHALLGQLREAGAEAVAMEVSSHALDQGRVEHVHYDVAVFTNLSRDHLDYHGDMASYAEAKARLSVWPGLRAAVVNLDDGFCAALPPRLQAGVRAITFSARGERRATLYAQRVRQGMDGIGFELVLGGRCWPLHSPLLGRFNIDNLLAVAGVLHALELSAVQIAELLPRLQPIPGRMNRLGGDDGQPLAVVDYSHKPDPLQQALQSLRDHLRGRLICVFGCGGERDRGKRAQMAAIAERLADRVYVTDDNPRGEDGDAIVADIMVGFGRPQAVVVERDRAAAIMAAITAAGPDDIVLIAGKGHETYQEVAGVRYPFDDRRVAARALATGGRGVSA